MGSQHTFDHDLAKRWKAQGMPVWKIAKTLNVSKSWISRVCRDVVFASAAPKGYERPRPGPPGISDEQLAMVLAAFEAGMCITHAAKHVGVNRESLRRAGVRGRIDLDRAPRGKTGRSSAEARRETGMSIPKWVKAAGLTEDFRDLYRCLGEEHALRACRRLKAEASRP